MWKRRKRNDATPRIKSWNIWGVNRDEKNNPILELIRNNGIKYEKARVILANRRFHFDRKMEGEEYDYSALNKLPSRTVGTTDVCESFKDFEQELIENGHSSTVIHNGFMSNPDMITSNPGAMEYLLNCISSLNS